jgi:hypothetical protein
MTVSVQDEAPFRKAEIRTRCTAGSCEEMSEDHACPRCGRALCATHAVSGEQRCARCEQDLVELIARRRRLAWSAFWIAVAVYLLSCASIGFSLGMKVGFAPLVLVVGFGAVAVWLQDGPARCRRRFLKERPGPKSLH